jgi:uncharacterized repeat protein (TIGR02543 family)
MIKKLLIIILALCMVITMLPNVALAYTPEAKWGEAEVDGSKPDAENWMGAGTLADAINYANGLSSGTAYIQLGHDIHVESPLTFDKGKAIILDLYGKTITRSTYSDSDANSPVIIVSSGELNIKDTSDTKMGSILNTNSGNDTSGIKQTGGTVNFYSGGIIAAGQAFYLVGGTFNMYGGQLIGLPVDEQATHEALGAVSNSTFNIYDGYLTGSLAYWGDTKAGAVNGNAYGGYFSDDSIQVQPGYTIVNVSDPVSITIPTITINDINFSSFSFYKTVTKTTYNINYILDGGTNGENPATYQITTPTITLAEATKTGYTFAGWFDASSGGNQVTQIALGSTGDKTLYARWTANTDTAYIVEHYQEGVSGAGYTLMDTDNLTGTTDDTATAEAKSYTGFTENTTHGSRVASGTIDADGSLVLKLYYDRNRPVAGFGKALDFASSERIDVPYNAGTKIAGQSDFTISMWVYPRDDSIYQTLYRQMNEDDEKLGLDIRLIKHDDKAYIYYAFNKMGVDWQRVFTWGDATSISNVMKIPFDQWTHVAIVKSGPNVQAYINGVADTEYGHMELGNVWYNAEAPADGIINIGMGKIEENQYFSGRMDEVQFWNVALTQAQIEAWMYREIDDTHLYDDKPVFYYKMNQSSGTSVTDFAGTNHGTFVNMDDSNWVDCDVRTWTVGAGQAVTGYLVGSDTKGSSTNGTDWNLTFEITEQGSKGTAAITSDNQFTYTAGIDKSGADSFKYKVKDGDDYYSDEHTVNIDIEQATFTVTFDKNGGSDLSSANKTVTYGETYGDLATVSREGYTFDGWYTASTGGSKIEAGTTVTITEDQTLYAQWTAKNNTQYKVEHYQQDVSGDSYRLGYTENTYGTTGSTVTAIAKTFTGFTENTTHGSRLATAAISADGSLVLKLYYDRDTFTVSFDSDEGSDVGNKTGVRYEAKITSPDAPTKTGYTFDGWYKEEGLTNAWNFASDTVTAATTLYAKWTPSTYTVTFNKNGGSDPSYADKTVTYGETYGDLATVSRAGYTFDGWYTASTGGSKIEAGTTVTITADQTLYAQWDRKKRAETEPVQPKPTQSDVIVIVNGKENVAATETITTEDEKTTVTIEVDQKAIEAKIDEAIANNPTGTGNTIQVPVSNTDAQVAKVELTGDIVKELEENSFDLLVTRDHIQYVIPAEEISTMQVAKTLGVPENDLEEIKIEVKMNRMEEEVVAKYDEMVRSNGAELIFPPVEFGITARSTKADGTTQTVEINKFSNYVERIMEIPEGVDPSKITTGVVFNRDGTYNHVPTVVFEKDGKWFAKISSLTNSTYSVIWNPVTVKSVEKHWSKDTVNDMAARLVIFNPDTFEPDKAITREDFAEYIVRALGLYREGQQIENKFTDVPSTGTRTLAILIAKEYGLVSGYPDQTFRPTQRITREEAMSMLQRAMQVTKLVGYDQDRYKNFTDFNKVSSWAQTVVKEALSAHVFNGTSATAISPKSNLTYAETAQAIKNLLVESKLIN